MLNDVRIILVGAIALWALVGALSRFWGAVLGVAFSSIWGAWGFWVMARGGHIYLLTLDRPLTAGAFYALVCVLTLANVATALRHITKRPAQEHPP